MINLKEIPTSKLVEKIENLYKIQHGNPTCDFMLFEREEIEEFYCFLLDDLNENPVQIIRSHKFMMALKFNMNQLYVYLLLLINFYSKFLYYR